MLFQAAITSVLKNGVYPFISKPVKINDPPLIVLVVPGGVGFPTASLPKSVPFIVKAVKKLLIFIVLFELASINNFYNSFRQIQ